MLHQRHYGWGNTYIVHTLSIIINVLQGILKEWSSLMEMWCPTWLVSTYNLWERDGGVGEREWWEGGERERRQRGIHDIVWVYSLFQESNFSVTNEDVYISYLPLAHMLERICHVMVLQSGGRIGFYRGDIKLLIDDIQALRPTLFVSVPRLLNRIYDKVEQPCRASYLRVYVMS